jgi:hypothetical protein
MSSWYKCCHYRDSKTVPSSAVQPVASCCTDCALPDRSEALLALDQGVISPSKLRGHHSALHRHFRTKCVSVLTRAGHVQSVFYVPCCKTPWLKRTTAKLCFGMTFIITTPSSSSSYQYHYHHFKCWLASSFCPAMCSRFLSDDNTTLRSYSS